jgi:glycosyltransferase involved in cell wall biosynthesis
MAEAPYATVAIPTHNKAPFLDLTLASFAALEARSYQLIVVDDGSTDETSAVLRSYEGRLPLEIVRTQNRGRSAARNEAIQRAAGEIVIFSDDDRIVAPTFIEAHVRRHQHGSKDKVVYGWQEGIATRWSKRLALPIPALRAILRHRPDLAERATSDRLDATEEPITLLDVRELRARFAEAVGPLTVPEPWWTFCGPIASRYGDELEGFHIPWILASTGNFSAPRRALREVGGLDEGFVGWGLEDNDLCYRLYKQGLPVVIERQATSYHQVHPGAPVAPRWLGWLHNLSIFMAKYEELAPVLYAYVFTRGAGADVEELNRMVAESETFAKAAPACARHLHDSIVELVNARIALLRLSKAPALPGAEW